MAVENHIYDRNFFRNTIKFEAKSAADFVDIVLGKYSPQSLADIGCGAGIYLKEFENRGIEDILGIDGAVDAAEEFLADKRKLVIHDLSLPYSFSRRYDLALCLEVAEHLPESAADVLMDTIVTASDDVLFSAAVPGQGPRSIGHINEQPHAYWAEKFEQRGYMFLGPLTEALQRAMAGKDVVWWITNNLLIFQKKS
jgi:SAM-dependent methyltransferase